MKKLEQVIAEAMLEAKKKKLHPNQQKLDVHEPEKDELTAKDFEMLRKSNEDVDLDEAEQIDELKTSTLTRYGTKATQSLGKDPEKTEKRIKGIQAARYKVQQKSMKEDVDLDEADETIIQSFDLYEQEDVLTYKTFLDAAETYAKLADVNLEEERAEIIKTADAAFREVDMDFVVEAYSLVHVQDTADAHRKAGHDVSSVTRKMKDGMPMYHYTVTNKDDGKVRKYIYHGNKKKAETVGQRKVSKDEE